MQETDPELVEVFDHFAFDEVPGHNGMHVKTRVLPAGAHQPVDAAIALQGYPRTPNVINCLNKALPPR